MQAIPTIHFQGNCNEALSYYCKALGAELLFRFKVSDVVDPQSIRPGTGERIMRAGLRIGQSVFHLADGHGADGPALQGFSLALVCDGHDQAQGLLETLAEGGSIRFPLRATTWAEQYATVVDRFGLHWTIEAGRRLIS